MGMIGNTPYNGIITGDNIAPGSIPGSDLAPSAIVDRLGYTPVNKAGDTVTGALFTNRLFSSNSGEITLPSGTYTGWYKIARSALETGNNGVRGGCTVYVQTIGGNYAPTQDKIELFKDWTTAAGLTVTQRGPYKYFSDYRVTGDGNYAYLEGYLAGVTGYPADIFSIQVEQDGYSWGTSYWVPMSGNIQAGVASPTFQVKPKVFTTAEGYLKTPNNPAFYAHYTVQNSITAGATLAPIPNAVRHNVGNCYNTATGRFTAPVTGVYMFVTALGLYGSGTASAYLSSEVYVNGVRTSVCFWEGTEGGYDRHQSVHVLPLNAGDYAQLGYESATSNVIDAGSIHGAFQGYLIG